MVGLVDHRLGVVALLEPLGRGVHDLALGVGEVALRARIGLTVIALVRPPPLGVTALPGLRPRASSAARCAASRRSLASRIAARRFSLCRSSAGTRRRAPALHNARLPPHRPRLPCPTTLRSPPSAESPRSTSAHSSSPCACSRWRAPSSRRPTACQAHHPHLARHSHHLDEQPFEVLKMTTAKFTNRAVLRKFPAAKTRNATSSSSFLAIAREETRPSRSRKSTP